MEGVAQCWTEIADSEASADLDANTGERAVLKAELKSTFMALADACPSVKEAEYVELGRLDPMFKVLINNAAL
jgi:hypothetical protein